MDLYQALFKRRSVRSYKSEPIPQVVLDRVLESLRVAPSAANQQPCRFIIVKDPGMRFQLRKAYDREWMAEAPVIVAGCVDPAKAWKRVDGFNAAEIDLAIAFDHLTLAAANEGLGSCWICNFDEKKAKEVLGVPEGVRLIALMPLGYPVPEVAARPFSRKPLAEILHHDKW
jgi:nitroreductase